MNVSADHAPGNEAAASPAPDPFAPEGVVFRSVSPRLAAVRLLGHLLTLAVVAVALGVGAVLWKSWLWWGMVVLVLVAAWLCWLVPRQVRAMCYALAEDHLLWRKGVMFRRLSVIPYGRMQFVDTSQGPIAARLGIAEVKLHTASAWTDATIEGLPVDEAENLRRILSRRGEQRMAGL